jgi:predicted DNA-binding protein (UPF0251 family)
MSRPKKLRKVTFNPDIIYFKPRAVPLAELQEVKLNLDELEAVRLCDLEKVEQKEVAKKMKISQSTLSRIVASARKKIAQALIEGRAIAIQKK